MARLTFAAQLRTAARFFACVKRSKVQQVLHKQKGKLKMSSFLPGFILKIFRIHRCRFLKKSVPHTECPAHTRPKSPKQDPDTHTQIQTDQDSELRSLPKEPLEDRSAHTPAICFGIGEWLANRHTEEQRRDGCKLFFGFKRQHWYALFLRRANENPPKLN